jgi:hypothetical protein
MLVATLRVGTGALGTQPANGEVVEAHLKSKPAADHVVHRLEIVGRHRAYLAAAFAIEVFVLAASDEGVQAWAVSEVHVLDDTVRLKGFQVAIDRGDVHAHASRNPLG